MEHLSQTTSLKKQQHCRSFSSNKETKTLAVSIAAEHRRNPFKAISTSYGLRIDLTGFFETKMKGPFRAAWNLPPAVFSQLFSFANPFPGPNPWSTAHERQRKPGTRCADCSAAAAACSWETAAAPAAREWTPAAPRRGRTAAGLLTTATFTEVQEVPSFSRALSSVFKESWPLLRITSNCLKNLPLK